MARIELQVTAEAIGSRLFWWYGRPRVLGTHQAHRLHWNTYDVLIFHSGLPEGALEAIAQRAVAGLGAVRVGGTIQLER